MEVRAASEGYQPPGSWTIPRQLELSEITVWGKQAFPMPYSLNKFQARVTFHPSMPGIRVSPQQAEKLHQMWGGHKLGQGMYVLPCEEPSPGSGAALAIKIGTLDFEFQYKVLLRLRFKLRKRHPLKFEPFHTRSTECRRLILSTDLQPELQQHKKPARDCRIQIKAQQRKLVCPLLGQ